MCLGDDLCYLENGVIKQYLDLPSTRSLLGVESPGNFSACSDSVGHDFNVHMDKWRSPTQYYISGLLDRGIRVLLYAGTYDWQCNWVQNKLWIEKLEWSGMAAYMNAEWRNWTLDGDTVVGETKSASVLTFATIRGAGHMMSFSFSPLHCLWF
jgi:carboxypeptidase C (cathepsin A)